MNLLKKYIFLLCLFFPSNTYPQTTFSLAIDNNQNSEGADSIIQLEDGSFVIASGCLINPTWYDCMQLLKTDSLGNVIWNKQYDRRKPGYRGTLNPTSDGGFTLGTWWYADIGEPEDVFLLKFNSEGDTLWTRQFGGIGRDIGWDTAELPDGSLVVVGITESFGAGDEDIYVVKTDVEGNFQWERTFGGINRDASTNIWIEDSGNIIISGITFDTPTDNAAGILLRLDSEGNELWRRIILHVPGKDNCGTTIHPSIIGGFIFKGCRDTLINEGDADYPYYVGRLDAEANVEWITYFNAPRAKFVATIYELADGHIMVQGINKNHPEAGIYNTAWLAKVSPQGEVLWERNYQGEEGDYSWDIQDMCVALDGGFALAGRYRNLIEAPDNEGDVWLLKVDSMGCLERGCGSELIRVPPNVYYTDIEEVEIGGKERFWIYPNPVSGESRVFIGEKAVDRLQIFDLQGKMLLSYSIDKGMREVWLKDLSLDWREGMYFCRLLEEGRVVGQKKLLVRD